MTEEQRYIKQILIALHEAASQIEYMHLRFQETGSGNSTLAKIEYAIELGEKLEKGAETPCQ